MCYNFNNKLVDLEKAADDFNAEKTDPVCELLGSVNAFSKSFKPNIPAIVNQNGIVLKNTFWGTIENPDSATRGKNLQSERTHTYYRKIENNRCLIPASSYYEHKKFYIGNKKTPINVKHEMFWEDKMQFYIAGFYDIYSDGSLGFGFVTTLPNQVQAEIHDRMIITLDVKKGLEFLNQKPIEDFQYPVYSPKLEYINLEPNKVPKDPESPNTLF